MSTLGPGHHGPRRDPGAASWLREARTSLALDRAQQAAGGKDGMASPTRDRIVRVHDALSERSSQPWSDAPEGFAQAVRERVARAEPGWSQPISVGRYGIGWGAAAAVLVLGAALTYFWPSMPQSPVNGRQHDPQSAAVFGAVLEWVVPTTGPGETLLALSEAPLRREVSLLGEDTRRAAQAVLDRLPFADRVGLEGVSEPTDAGAIPAPAEGASSR